MLKTDYNDGSVLWKNRILFDGFKLSTVIGGKTYEVGCEKIHGSDSEIVFEFANSETGTVGSLKIVKTDENTMKWYFSGKIIQKEVYPPIKIVDEKKGYTITFNTLTVDGVCAKYMCDTCWSYADFNRYKIPEETQALLVKNGCEHIAFMPLCTEKFKTQLCSERANEIKVYMGADCTGYTDNEGCIMTVAVSGNPAVSVKLSLSEAEKLPEYVSVLKEERPYPEFMKYLGWCTWDACYFDVSRDLIEKKMEEFKRKGIKLGWVLIDDGWFTFSENRIQNLYADKNKFPDGLSGTVKMLKEKYGVRYVGIWHSFNAYWYGIDENSEAYRDNKEYLIKTKAGVVLPDYTDKDKAFAFFDKWHSYLKAEGIDFLKVDTQGCLTRFTKDNIASSEAVANIQYALEKSVHKNFGGNMINCMAMGMEHIQNRQYSNLLRNSVDFWPKRPNSFKKHLTMNLYNAVFLNDLYYLDFDMWWTDNDFAVQSAVLRAVSGGPIYISDEIEATRSDVLAPLADDDGKIIVCNEAALTTCDMIYEDYINGNRIIKAANSIADASVLALFNAEEREIELSCEVTYDDIKTADGGDYIAYCYFIKKFYRFGKETRLTVSLKKNEAELINFYPVKDNCIYLGDMSKYISAGFNPKKISLDELHIENEE